MIAYNPKDVETLNILSKIFDFANNPEKYKPLISSVSAVVDEYKQYVGLYNTVEKANQVLASAKSKELAAMEEIKKAENKASEIVDSAAKVAKNLKLEAEEQARKSAEQEQKVLMKQKELDLLEAKLKSLEANLKTKETDLSNKEVSLKDREDKLNKQLQDLSVKAEQLKKFFTV